MKYIDDPDNMAADIRCLPKQGSTVFKSCSPRLANSTDNTTIAYWGMRAAPGRAIVLASHHAQNQCLGHSNEQN